MHVSNTPTYTPPYSTCPGSISNDGETPAAPRASRSKRGVAIPEKLWPQHKTLTIAFMDTPKSARKFIQKYIEENYSPLINIKLKFVKGTEGDIRISTHKDIPGDWSRIGTDALNAPPDQPTLHLNTYATEDILKMNILHEFGHALGLHHEHQHPDRTVEFNTPSTYTLYNEKFGFDESTVDANILNKFDPADITSAPYDQQSIMHYNLSHRVLWQQPSTDYNLTLSNHDIAFLNTLYPPASVEKKKPLTDREKFYLRMSTRGLL